MKTLENIKKIPREIAHLLSKDKKLCSLLIDDSNEPKIENLPSFEFLLNNNYINLMTPVADGQINQKGRNNYIVIILDNIDFETAEDDNIGATINIYVVSNFSYLLINDLNNRLLEMMDRIYQILDGQKLSSSGELRIKTASRVQIDEFNDAYRINFVLSDQQSRKVSI